MEKLTANEEAAKSHYCEIGAKMDEKKAREMLAKHFGGIPFIYETSDLGHYGKWIYAQGYLAGINAERNKGGK